MQTIAFIGGGQMARALVGGLVASGYTPQHLVVTDPSDSQLAWFRDLGVRVSSDNPATAAAADVVVLAVKPQVMRQVAESLAPALAGRQPLVVSIAAGIRCDALSRWLGGHPVVRAMPNRPALQNCGASGLYAPPAVPAAHRDFATRILGAAGLAVWVDREDQLDAVTALSGSGPAYFFLLIEMLEATGIQLGLPPEVSRRLAVATAHGAGRMAFDGSDPPAVLREQVTSRGGTTEAALGVLEQRNVRAIFAEAITAAARRSAELAAS